MRSKKTKKPKVVVEDTRESDVYAVRITVDGKEVYSGDRGDVGVWELLDVAHALGAETEYVDRDKRK